MELSRRTRARMFGVTFGLVLATIAGGIAIVTGPTGASAQQMDAEQACTPDVMQLCNEAIPDRGKIVACLRAKRKQVSLTCRQAMGSHGKKSKRRRVAR